MSEATTEAVEVGKVADAFGEELTVYRTPNRSVLIYGRFTKIGFDPAGAETLRELLDRAEMPGQEQAAGPAEDTVAECDYCTTRITMLGGYWTADDGTIACADTSAAFVAHKPGRSES